MEHTWMIEAAKVPNCAASHCFAWYWLPVTPRKCLVLCSPPWQWILRLQANGDALLSTPPWRHFVQSGAVAQLSRHTWVRHRMDALCAIESSGLVVSSHLSAPQNGWSKDKILVTFIQAGWFNYGSPIFHSLLLWALTWFYDVCIFSGTRDSLWWWWCEWADGGQEGHNVIVNMNTTATLQ